MRWGEGRCATAGGGLTGRVHPRPNWERGNSTRPPGESGSAHDQNLAWLAFVPFQRILSRIDQLPQEEHFLTGFMGRLDGT